MTAFMVTRAIFFIVFLLMEQPVHMVYEKNNDIHVTLNNKQTNLQEV